VGNNNNQRIRNQEENLEDNILNFLSSSAISKGVYLPCDDAIASFVVVVVVFFFLDPNARLLYTLHQVISFKSRGTAGRSQWPCVCVQVPDCPVSLSLSLSLSSRVCTFSDPSRLFDDFSGESNNHKQKKKRKNPA
jgi:hypothetical protein